MTDNILIVGTSPCAMLTAKLLVQQHQQVTIAATANGTDIPGAEVLSHTRIKACQGGVGNFTITFEKDGSTFQQPFAQIVLAEDSIPVPHFATYGLKPSDTVHSLSQLPAVINRLKSKTIVFLNGVLTESQPFITKEVMAAALTLQSELSAQTYIMTRHLKVAQTGLEALYRQCKIAGTVFIKFTQTTPKILQTSDSVRIEYTDEVTQQNFALSPDVIVVDEATAPSAYVLELGRIFRLHTDVAGFLQSDNVHRLPVFTNRKGILAAGPSRCAQSEADHLLDAHNAVWAVNSVISEVAEGKAVAQIMSGCVRCLTCYRTCPYKAIQLDTKVSVMPLSCEGCGICAAECPRGVIQMDGLQPVERGTDMAGHVVVFCCKRSASEAAQTAQKLSLPLPERLKIVEVPCAGSISMRHLLRAFQEGAAGVMVLTCHDGNCHSEIGNQIANNRVQPLIDRLPQLKIEKERFMIHTLSSNMAKEFSDITQHFVTSLEVRTRS